LCRIFEDFCPVKFVKKHKYKSAFDAIAKEIKDDEGNAIEVWYARELQQVLGYAR